MENSEEHGMKLILDTFKNIVDKNKKFVLTTHVNPDGDGLGSELALTRFLKKLGKQSVVLNHSETPSNHTFLDYHNELKQFDPAADGQTILDADVLIALDMNNPGRLRSVEEYFMKSKAEKLIIDHHLEAQDFVDHKLIDLDAPATAEIVYRCLAAYDSNLIDKEIAEGIYTGLMTDTGSFRFPRTDGDVHRITAELLDRGVDPFYIYHHLYEENSIGRTRLLGEMLSNVGLAYEGRVSHAAITLEQLKRNNVVPDDVDNFVNQAGAIAGVIVTLFFLELEDGVKISFRSKGDVPVNELAKMYGGGGHKNASGARLSGVKLDETVEKVLTDTSKILPK